jgi:hypothetical protein
VKRLLVLAAALALAACAATQQPDAVAPQAPGFLLGLWHGFIFPVAWIVSLFTDKVAIYAVPNNGGWYDFGYFLGIMVFGVGAKATLVGAATIFPYVEDFNFRDWRLDVGLAAATTGSVYLLGWSQRKHSNRRHRTISVVAAVVGLIPIVSTLATNLLLKD